MQDFTWVEILSEYTPSADETKEVEMGTRPKAGLAIRLSCLNASVKATYAQILGALEDLRIELFGSSIIQLSGSDLAALNSFLLGRGMIQENVVDTDNATRSLVLYVPFGTTFMDSTRGLWETAPDEAKLQLQVDIADTGYDGLILNVMALEIPGAAFSECLRYKTLTHTPTATGQSDADLPRTHPTIAYMIYSTTVHTGTAWTTSADALELLEDRNPEKFLSNHWETWHGLADIWAKDFGAYNEKIHVENTGATYAQNADTAAEQAADNFLENYIWLPFCPDGDLDSPYDPTGFTDLKMRFTAGDTNAIRIVPVEYQTPR